MTKLYHHAPMAAAGLALLGCLLPFAASNGPGGQSVDLFSLPGQFAEAAHTLTSMAGPGMFGQQTAEPPADTSGAIWLARLLYIVPILAVTVIVVNLRGPVTRVLQFAVAGLALHASGLLAQIKVPRQS